MKLTPYVARAGDGKEEGAQKTVCPVGLHGMKQGAMVAQTEKRAPHIGALQLQAHIFAGCRQFAGRMN